MYENITVVGLKYHEMQNNNLIGENVLNISKSFDIAEKKMF